MSANSPLGGQIYPNFLNSNDIFSSSNGKRKACSDDHIASKSPAKRLKSSKISAVEDLEKDKPLISSSSSSDEEYLATSAENHSPTRSDLSVEEHSPTRSDLSVEEHSPTRSDLFVEEHSPTRSDLFVEEHSPTRSDLSVEEHSPNAFSSEFSSMDIPSLGESDWDSHFHISETSQEIVGDIIIPMTEISESISEFTSFANERGADISKFPSYVHEDISEFTSSANERGADISKFPSYVHEDISEFTSSVNEMSVGISKFSSYVGEDISDFTSHISETSEDALDRDPIEDALDRELDDPIEEYSDSKPEITYFSKANFFTKDISSETQKSNYNVEQRFSK